MKIYTKTGDDGTTGLFAGGRVPKDHPRIAAYGSVDELNALLGIVACHARAAQSTNPTARIESLTNSNDRKPVTSSLMPQAETEQCLNTLLQIIERAQHDLFAIGAELATPTPTANGTKLLTESDGHRLEAWIDELESKLDPLTAFIIPGGSLLAGWLHWARTVCRRAERDVVHLAHQSDVADCTTVIVYLNRLSDLLFVMARVANSATGFADVPWMKPA